MLQNSCLNFSKGINIRCGRFRVASESGLLRVPSGLNQRNLNWKPRFPRTGARPVCVCLEDEVYLAGFSCLNPSRSEHDLENSFRSTLQRRMLRRVLDPSTNRPSCKSHTDRQLRPCFLSNGDAPRQEEEVYLHVSSLLPSLRSRHDMPRVNRISVNGSACFHRANGSLPPLSAV